MIFEFSYTKDLIVVPVWVGNKTKSGGIELQFLLDTGSTTSFLVAPYLPHLGYGKTDKIRDVDIITGGNNVKSYLFEVSELNFLGCAVQNHKIVVKEFKRILYGTCLH
jgi:hypothetical protein